MMKKKGLVEYILGLFKTGREYIQFLLCKSKDFTTSHFTILISYLCRAIGEELR